MTTTGCPCGPSDSAARTPFSSAAMKLRGTTPPTMRSLNTTSPSSRGATSSTTCANCPWPPVCLTSRPTTPATARIGVSW
ncbi:hypothetical protein G6F31_021503 [Rhizopus arrhizus]|nr:hypothetical protein G6F31_021503 [Rhizopus arrhizus]